MIGTSAHEVHEIVLREGRPDDLLTYVDGLLLTDLWDELLLPGRVRAVWSPLVAAFHPQKAA